MSSRYGSGPGPVRRIEKISGNFWKNRGSGQLWSYDHQFENSYFRPILIKKKTDVIFSVLRNCITLGIPITPLELRLRGQPDIVRIADREILWLKMLHENEIGKLKYYFYYTIFFYAQFGNFENDKSKNWCNTL